MIFINEVEVLAPIDNTRSSSYNADDSVARWDEGYYVLQNDTITFHKATSGSDLQLSIKPSSYSYWINGQSISNQSFILSSISTSSSSSKLDEYVVAYANGKPMVEKTAKKKKKKATETAPTEESK